MKTHKRHPYAWHGPYSKETVCRPHLYSYSLKYFSPEKVVNQWRYVTCESCLKMKGKVPRI